MQWCPHLVLVAVRYIIDERRTFGFAAAFASATTGKVSHIDGFTLTTAFVSSGEYVQGFYLYSLCGGTIINFLHVVVLI